MITSTIALLITTTAKYLYYSFLRGYIIRGSSNHTQYTQTHTCHKRMIQTHHSVATNADKGIYFHLDQMQAFNFHYIIYYHIRIKKIHLYADRHIALDCPIHYFTNWFKFVSYMYLDTYSVYRNILCGVPQCNVLGPLLLSSTAMHMIYRTH